MNPLIAHEGHEHHPSIQGKAVADSIWEQEHIELVTVGIDIGSSTSHLIFARFICSDGPRDYRAVTR